MKLTSGALCVSVAIVGCPIAAQAQSAGKVIERYIEAIGGKKAVEKILGTDVSGTIRSGDGQSGVFIQRTSRPNRYFMSMSLGNSRWRSGFNGRSAWQEDGVEGLRTLYGQSVSRVRTEATYINTRYVESEQFAQLSIVRRDQLRGRPVIVVFMISPDSVTRTLFFDAGSYLLVKDEQQTDTGVEERFFDVIRVDSYFRDDYGRTAQGSSLRIERTLVNDEVWLPSRADLALRWNLFFGARSQWLTTLQCTDHKKFTVATDSAITLPDAQPDPDRPSR